MHKEENWKDIPGYEGLYQISDLGNVKCLPKAVRYRFGIRQLPEIIKKPYLGTNGYLNFRLTKDKAGKNYSAHRLVMLAFIGESNLSVDHINGEKQDNRLVNLRYCTVRENAMYHFGKSKKYVGVSLECDKYYRAVFKVGKKKIHVGNFKCETSAMFARQAALKKYENDVSVTA